MKSKSLILILFLCIVFGFAGILLLALLPAVSKDPDTSEDLNPISYPSGGKIDIFDGSNLNNSYGEYAAINSNDTISIYNGEEDPLVINIEKKNWKKIEWSPDGNLISVLGETSPTIFNLFIYDLKDKNWYQATFFEESSVLSYSWTDSDTLYFTQGENPDKWLYKYSYSAKTQNLKFAKVNGDIHEFSKDSKIAILQNSENTEFDYQIISIKTANDLYRLTYWKEGEDFINPEKVLFSSDGNFLSLTDMGLEGVNLYKSDFGSNEAMVIDSFKNYFPICATLEDTFLAYKFDEALETVSLSYLSLDKEVEEEVGFIKIKNISSLEQFECFETDKAIFGAKLKDETIRWYELNERFEIIPLEFLSSVGELDIRN